MIVITGASDGLGLQVAKLYKEAGKTVVNVSRRECKYADVNICLSLSEGAEIEKAAEKILELKEPLEVLVNCIGVFNNQKFGEITEEEIKRLMSTNVKAPALLSSLLIDRIRNDQTDILNVLSTAAVRFKATEPLYVASKWAARGFTLSLQDELRHTKSRVISFCPGGMQTNFFEKAEVDNDTSVFMDPVDIAKTIKYILDLPKNIEVSEIILNRK
jgi:short-subunit dehydrogenase